MKRLALLLLSAALLTGCGAATATPPATTPTASAIEEDDPNWNCLTDGNRVCGPNPIQRVEAWGMFQTDKVPADVLREAFQVTYMGTAMEGIDFPPSEYVTIPSHVSPKRVHVFHFKAGDK